MVKHVGHGTGCAVHSSVEGQGLQCHNTRCGSLDREGIKMKVNMIAIDIEVDFPNYGKGG